MSGPAVQAETLDPAALTALLQTASSWSRVPPVPRLPQHHPATPGHRTPHPAEAFAARPRALPTGPHIERHYCVRRDRADNTEGITLRYNSRLHHIGLGPHLAGTAVTPLVDDLHVRVINAVTGELLRELTIDLNRDYQPRK